MIRMAGPDDAREVLRRAETQPTLGAICAIHWRMQQENPHLPHRFYLLDGEGLLKISGGRGFLCGAVGDTEELISFLRFAGVEQLTALGFFPPGWQVVEQDHILLRAAESHKPTEVFKPLGFAPTPTGEEVLGVLESSDGQIHPQAARDFFYADFCARRNHGAAVVYGLRPPGAPANSVLAATAGLWALAAHEGYIACVETRPEHQGQGYASELLRVLCEEFGHLPLSLMCQEKLRDFYSRFGFLETGHKGIVSICPKEAAK